MKRKIISVILTVAMTLTVFAMPTGAFAATSASTVDKTLEDTSTYLKANTKAEYGYEWNIFDLARYGGVLDNSFAKNYGEAVAKYAKSLDGVLHSRKYTEYEKLAITYTAAGLDITNVGGYNMLKPLADFDKTVWQGTNSAIWALIAFDSGCYAIPKLTTAEKKAGAVQTTRANLIQHILDKQLADGGWDIADRAADPDMTGMALISIAPYYSAKNSPSTKATSEVSAALVAKVNAAVERGIETMQALQNDDAGYSCYGAPNVESATQVFVALCALGIDPQKDARFIKNGVTILDNIMTFYDPNGKGFRHVNTAMGGYEPIVNGLATYESFYGLLAYDRMTAGKSSLYTVKAPSRGSVSGLSNLSGKRIKVSWSAKNGANGYEIQIATNSKFTAGKKTVSIKSGATKTKTLTGSSKKKYYVRVRAYKEVAGVKSYGSWSSTKTVTIKK